MSGPILPSAPPLGDGWITPALAAHAPDSGDYDKSTIVFSVASAPRLAVGKSLGHHGRSSKPTITNAQSVSLNGVTLVREVPPDS